MSTDTKVDGEYLKKIRDELKLTRELKMEYKTLNKKLAELTEDELKQVVGGEHNGILATPGTMIHVPSYDDVIGGDDIAPSSTQAWFGGKEE